MDIINIITSRVEKSRTIKGVYYMDDTDLLGLVSDRRVLYYSIKRGMDMIFSLLFLILLSPFFALITLGITIYSPGPIFFKQERMGAVRISHAGKVFWKKQKFICYKFRTMKVNSDSKIHEDYIKALINENKEKMNELQGGTTEIRKLTSDPRVTRPGKLLRKLSLDELPQFWNVLRGDMSLVGPRPAIPYEVEMYKPWYIHRLEAQPGITGLQQVTARCTASFEEQVKLDIEYIKRQSIWLDLLIMIKTPIVILSTKGAE
jgi:lipopolysaccharide/colanic/teichoic acid biosynthesis glycosyltransferase